MRRIAIKICAGLISAVGLTLVVSGSVSAVFPDPDTVYEAWNRDKTIYASCNSFGSGSLDITVAEAGAGQLDFPMEINNLGPGDCFYAEVWLTNTTDLPLRVTYAGAEDDGTIADFLFEWLSGAPNDAAAYPWPETVLAPGESTTRFVLNVGMPMDVGNEAQGTAGNFWFRWQVSNAIEPRTPDAPEILSPADGETLRNDTTPEISGRGEAGATVTVTDADGRVLCTATVTADGTWACRSVELEPGEHRLIATQQLPDGEISPASAPVTLIIELFKEEVDPVFVDPSVPDTGMPGRPSPAVAIPVISLSGAAVALLVALGYRYRAGRR